MNTSRRIRHAADVAVGYAADSHGHGIAYASIANGTSARVARLTFSVKPMPTLEGREFGYAAIAAVGQHLKSGGFGRVRIRIADVRIAAELNGSAAPPKALSMAYVRVRCLLRGLGAVRLEAADLVEIRDLATRAVAEVSLHAAA